jgi:hypothetical protein
LRHAVEALGVNDFLTHFAHGLINRLIRSR